MALILALSSQVARGHVGLSGIVPAVQAVGHQTMAVPTVLLSNHLGHSAVAGEPIPPKQLEDIIDALDANGWLGDVDAVLIGYLPTADHVAFAVELVQRIKSKRATAPVVLDPILGDDPAGLYVRTDVAQAIKADLVAQADILMPNRFELSWLSGLAVTDCQTANAAAQTLVSDTRSVVTTSIPCVPTKDVLATLVSTSGTSKVACQTRIDGVPHGTGDVLSGLMTAWLLDGLSLEVAVSRALGSLQSLIEASIGRDELCLVPVQTWIDAEPMALENS
jgi:pyridoxine kinase